MKKGIASISVSDRRRTELTLLASGASRKNIIILMTILKNMTGWSVAPTKVVPS